MFEMCYQSTIVRTGRKAPNIKYSKGKRLGSYYIHRIILKIPSEDSSNCRESLGIRFLTFTIFTSLCLGHTRRFKHPNSGLHSFSYKNADDREGN